MQILNAAFSWVSAKVPKWLIVLFSGLWPTELSFDCRRKIRPLYYANMGYIWGCFILNSCSGTMISSTLFSKSQFYLANEKMWYHCLAFADYNNICRPICWDRSDQTVCLPYLSVYYNTTVCMKCTQAQCHTQTKWCNKNWGPIFVCTSLLPQWQPIGWHPGITLWSDMCYSKFNAVWYYAYRLLCLVRR